MTLTRDHLSEAPEVLVVGLAKTGDKAAFAELIRRRQSWIRQLMRRWCGDVTLADDLAQDVFLLAWRKIAQLRQVDRFGAWLKRLAINIWLQHLRKHDALRDADEPEDEDLAQMPPEGEAVDLDRALAFLSEPQRLCVVLNYNEGMTHGEIAEMTELPLGTVKSHIRRGTERLRRVLADYERDVNRKDPT